MIKHSEEEYQKFYAELEKLDPKWSKHLSHEESLQNGLKGILKHFISLKFIFTDKNENINQVIRDLTPAIEKAIQDLSTTRFGKPKEESEIYD
ncbi:hypothetical protein RyT2_19190 [Pseudolactococcus yaeyamensis]